MQNGIFCKTIFQHSIVENFFQLVILLTQICADGMWKALPETFSLC
ncbi:uncharacterized protein METZ01_LOCUS30179 [marine metagenome]|uniref:Uncharacterized protein n=1 Tax=marine metagenome TaxID=408172 RepID=A0A381QDC5_9ZZZZ